MNKLVFICSIILAAALGMAAFNPELLHRVPPVFLGACAVLWAMILMHEYASLIPATTHCAPAVRWAQGAGLAACSAMVISLCCSVQFGHTFWAVTLGLSVSVMLSAVLVIGFFDTPYER